MNYGMEGAKYGISFGTALAIALSYNQPVDPVGDHPRLLQLALCDLFRAVQVGPFLAPLLWG